MTNYEKHRTEIEPITRLGMGIAIEKETGKIVPCNSLRCSECLFKEEEKACSYVILEWADAEYIEPEVDWTKVSVDTPVLVRNSTGMNWERRHFAKNNDGKVYAWNDGLTSFTSNSKDRVTQWTYAKLAEVDNGI